jgi:serine/threonine protein kinase
MTLPSVWHSTFELNAEEPLLGGGAFAKILRVSEKSSGTQYAIKVMNRPNFAIRGIEAQLDAEIEAMRQCAKKRQCRHVVRLYESQEENSHVYLRLELCKCDLLRYANSQPNLRLEESDTTDFTRQLLVGLRDLHGLRILHRDIKPENLLITSDGILKIADFGWCADLNDKPSTLAGTFQYMAPEILGSLGVQTEACDVWSSGVTIIQLATGRPLLTTYLGPGATGISNTDPHQATKIKTNSLLEEIHQKCPLADEARPADMSWRCWDCLRSMLLPEVAQRMTIDAALSHSWLEVSKADIVAQEALAAPLDECPSVEPISVAQAAEVVQAEQTPAISARQSSQPELGKAVVDSSASSDSELSQKLDQVPTPPCALTPVKKNSIVVPTRSLPTSVPALPPSTPSSTRSAQVTKLIVSGGLTGTTTTPLHTPKPTPKQTPHATPARHIGGDIVRCRRSETAPSQLPLQADALASSRLPGTEPASPCATSRTPLTRTPIANKVQRAQTAIDGIPRTPLLDSTIFTLESMDDLHFRHPALQECETRMSSIVRQLESQRSANWDHDKNGRGSSVGVRYESRSIKENGTVPDLRTFTELVRSCGQTMRRASTAVGEEVTSRRASYELRRPHEVARSVTLKPRSRRRAESPLRATMGSLPSPGLATPSANRSVAAPVACSVSVPAKAMSISAPSGILAGTIDTLSRTMPSEFTHKIVSRLEADTDGTGEKASADKLMRQTAVVRARPLSYSVSTSAPLKQSQTGGYPQRLTTSTPSHTVERLSPRPYVTTTSSRSPLVPLRASPPATPGASGDTFRDVMLARSNTVSTVPIAVQTM